MLELSYKTLNRFFFKFHEFSCYIFKILELVEQSKGWSSLEQTRDSAENVMMGISEEELYDIPTANVIHRRGGFVQRFLTVYHVAFHALADLKDVEVLLNIFNLF